MENDILQLKQDLADGRFEQNAKLEALDMYEQWLEGQGSVTAKILRERFGIMNYCGVLVPRPRQYFIEVYTVSKWESEDYNRIRNEEFKKLKLLVR